MTGKIKLNRLVGIILVTVFLVTFSTQQSYAQVAKKREIVSKAEKTKVTKKTVDLAGRVKFIPWADGDILATLNKPWKGNKLGIDHTVPPPWKPIAVQGTTVEYWGRQTQFDGKAFPQQILSQGLPLLAGPVSVFIEDAKGKIIQAKPGTGKMVESFPDIVVWKGKTFAGGILIKSKVEIEFDGYTWVSITVGGNSKIKIKRVYIDVPILPDVSKYYVKSFEGYSPAFIKDMWGKVSPGGKKLKLQDFILSNEERGISFFAEGLLGWWLERRNRQVEWIKKDDKLVVRYNIVDLLTPKPIAKKRTISFGWNALPLRPMGKDFRRYVMQSVGQEHNRYKRYVDTGMSVATIRLTCHVSAKDWPQRAKGNSADMPSCVPIDIPQPLNIKEFKEYKKQMEDLGVPGQVKFGIYTVGNHHNILDPRYFENWAEWSGSNAKLDMQILEKAFMTTGQMPGCRLLCGWSQSFVDYKVWFMNYWFKRLGLNAYYFDNQVFKSCRNAAHTDHQFFDERNKPIKVRPLRMYRQMAKRIYKTLKKSNPDCVLIGHGIFPMYPFVDFSLGAEYMHALAGKNEYYTEFLSAEDCRGPLMNGHVYGIPYMWLPEYRGRFQYGPESVKATRAMLSLVWLTDSTYWIAYCNTNMLYEDMKVRGQFKTWEAEWLPFWKQKVVDVGKNGVYVSVYRKKDSALLVVSNPGKQSYDNLTLTVNVGELFPDEPNLVNFEAKDPQNKENFEVNRWLSMDKIFINIPVTVKAQDYRTIWLKLKK